MDRPGRCCALREWRRVPAVRELRARIGTRTCSLTIVLCIDGRPPVQSATIQCRALDHLKWKCYYCGFLADDYGYCMGHYFEARHWVYELLDWHVLTECPSSVDACAADEDTDQHVLRVLRALTPAEFQDFLAYQCVRWWIWPPHLFDHVMAYY